MDYISYKILFLITFDNYSGSIKKEMRHFYFFIYHSHAPNAIHYLIFFVIEIRIYNEDDVFIFQ